MLFLNMFEVLFIQNWSEWFKSYQWMPLVEFQLSQPHKDWTVFVVIFMLKQNKHDTKQELRSMCTRMVM